MHVRLDHDQTTGTWAARIYPEGRPGRVIVVPRGSKQAVLADCERIYAEIAPKRGTPTPS